jgi:hypothetical protein
MARYSGGRLDQLADSYVRQLLTLILVKALIQSCLESGRQCI